MTPALKAAMTPDELLAAKPLPAKLAAFPKPTLSDIQSMYSMLLPAHSLYMKEVADTRQLRYQQDEVPQKYKRRLQGSRRFYSRLSHNEIQRIVAMMTRNAPSIRVMQKGTGARAEARAKKQSRWCNQLLPTFERHAGIPGLQRRFCDAMCESGKGIFEFYMADKSVYDDIDTDPQYVVDETTGIDRLETPKEILARTEEQLQGAFPFGLRTVDPLACLEDRDEDGIFRALIIEMKPYVQVYNKLMSTGKAESLRLPRPGTEGWPLNQGSAYGTNADNFSTVMMGTGATASDARQQVLTMRYYDRRWYVYIVGGRIVDGPIEHKLPGVPVFIGPGMLNSSPNEHERYQGVTWGMRSLEMTLNDLLTVETDSAMALSRPKPVVETVFGGKGMSVGPGGKPVTLDLSGEAAPYLQPGQRVVDAFANFQPKIATHALEMVMKLWERSGLNPIAQGESPGSDPAGYTVNTLQGAAQNQYEVLLDNYARVIGDICDFVRLVVRDTLKEKMYLSVPMGSSKADGVEWEGLAPEDVDEIPAVVEIDPLSDANRIAVRQSLEQANKEGFVPRHIVQSKGFAADDPEAWDDDIALDMAEEQLIGQAIQEAQQRIAMRLGQPQGGPGLVDQNGNPLPPSAPGSAGPGQPGAQSGAVPAPLQPPTVGKANAQSSHGGGVFGSHPGPAPLPAQAARGGQGPARTASAPAGGQP